MSFIQIIEHTTSKPDEIRALSQQMRAERPANPSITRMTVTKDRDSENKYFVIVEFTSYEAAMENSNDPATQEFAAKMAELVDGPPTFYNLDVVEQETY